MSMFKGFSNAFRIPELRKKILITLGLVAVCRLVSQIPTPGVDWRSLQAAIEDIRQASGGGMLDWFDVFTGGALGQCAIGFLSICRQRLAQITRYLTIVICIVQSWTIASLLLNPQALGINTQIVVSGSAMGFRLMTVIGMTSAALFVMWLADQITTFGVGNGGSLIIMINITSRLPHAIFAAYERYFGGSGMQTASPVELVLLLLFGFGVVMGTVMLVQGVRKVPIHATRRSMAVGNTYGMQQTFMPLRVNYTGVMPIIFAQPILQVLGWLFKKMPWDPCQSFGTQLSDMGSATHLIIYAIVIMFFCFFWVATQSASVLACRRPSTSTQ